MADSFEVFEEGDEEQVVMLGSKKKAEAAPRPRTYDERRYVDHY
ncbi:hypothetical protein [Streptomyces sp. TE5632]